MATETEKALNIVENIASTLKKTQINLKKSPKARLTRNYVETRLKCVEDYWSEYKQTYSDLIRNVPKEKRDKIPYIVNEEYFEHEELYLSLITDLKDLLNQQNKRQVLSMFEKSHFTPQPRWIIINNQSTALLATAIVKVRSEDNYTTTLRALIDQGSQASFISERAVQQLTAKRYPTKGTVVGVGSTKQDIKQVVQISIESRIEAFRLKVRTYVMSKPLTTKIPQIITILRRGGFELQKWASNDTDFLKSLDANRITTKANLDLKLDGTIKALELLRVIAYCKRFLKMKTDPNKLGQEMTTEEIQNALDVCITFTQQDEFSDEIRRIKERRSVKTTSILKSLNPFVDKYNILRVGGRLRNADADENLRHPVILGKRNGLVS
ncbi:hypothetical protein HW555_001771, partial [Spodoptera exigua]